MVFGFLRGGKWCILKDGKGFVERGVIRREVLGNQADADSRGIKFHGAVPMDEWIGDDTV